MQSIVNVSGIEFIKDEREGVCNIRADMHHFADAHYDEADFPKNDRIHGAPPPSSARGRVLNRRQVMSAMIPPAPQLKELAPYLAQLPPMIARKEVKYFTGGAISSKKLANDDSLGVGPDVRQKIGDAVVYPTAFFLAYLEKKGVKTIVPPKL